MKQGSFHMLGMSELILSYLSVHVAMIHTVKPLI